jgi:exonuclease VII large subunit
MLRRRHHCRTCGKVFCFSCAPGASTPEARICYICRAEEQLRAQHRRAEEQLRAQHRRAEEQLRAQHRRAEEQRRREEEKRRRAEEARRRAEEKCRRVEEQRQQELETRFVKEADEFIRTRRRFDTTRPLQYFCQVRLIESELSSIDELRFDNWQELLIAYEGINFAFSADRQSVRVMHLTPFQGESTHRVFGEFRCPCNKRWMSAATWKDKWQQCQNCDAKVYPHVQHTLEIADREDDDELDRRPHDMGRCQKCLEKGSLCIPSMYYGV